MARRLVTMRNKRRVVVALYHRNRLSLGGNRTELGNRAYHWGILIMPKRCCSSASDKDGGDIRGLGRSPSRHHRLEGNAYDATDFLTVDPVTHQVANLNHDWMFRRQRDIDPSATGRLIGRIVVGKLPAHVADADVEALLETVPLPVKGAMPPQSCVTWAMDALVTLQSRDLAWDFDPNEFRDWALAYGDECMTNLGSDNVYTVIPGSLGMVDSRCHIQRA